MNSTDAAPAFSPSNVSDPIAQIAAFARRASFETTRLTDAELDEVKEVALAGCAIFVSAIPSRPLVEQIDTTRRLRVAGFEPVPHLAVRNFASVHAMESHLHHLVSEGGARRALVIAGDRPEPAGPFHDALAGIASGLLQRSGIAEIGISGYPEGHPSIPAADLDRALAAKIAAAADNGLRVRIVTQFSLSAGPILAWIGRLRERGIDKPVSIGLAGPTSLSTLIRFARICGVKASVQGLSRNVGLVKNLLGSNTPDPIVRTLVETAGTLGDIAPHFFSFGGLPATARWASAVAAARIALRPKEGFEIVER